VAEAPPEGPATHERVEWGEWHSQDAQQDVRKGQIRDEYIRYRLHGSIPQDHIANQDIPKDSQNEDGGVQDVEEDLHELVVDDTATPVIVVGQHNARGHRRGQCPVGGGADQRQRRRGDGGHGGAHPAQVGHLYGSAANELSGGCVLDLLPVVPVRMRTT